MRLLHIEKDKDFITRVQEAAEENGVTYLNATTFVEASNMLKNLEIDLLIAADQLEGVKCAEFVNNLPGAGPSRLPVIVLGGQMDFDEKTQLYDKGVMACMNKETFNLKRLVRYIVTIKGEKQLIQDLRDFRIAVVDDNRLSLEVIKGFFSASGVTNVDYFQCSSEFINNAAGYDMYLIDYVMPFLDGEDLISHLRELDNDSIIILITAYGDDKTVPHCMNIGADDFILKPFNYKTFMLRIASCVRQFKMTRENTDQNKKLFELATRDSLTGIYNRTYFLDMHNMKANEALRNMQAFSLILLDIDHFKNVNDEYGHLKGDYVLKEMAQLLLNQLRETDTICRWGGEEFLVLCSNTDLENTTVVAEKLRSCVEKHVFEGVHPITVSLGVTQWKPDDNKDTAFKRLDNSLYLAKLTGRNKVVSNEEIQIIKGGLPVNIEWGPFFRSGHHALDAEHHALIVLSNEIIYSCFAENRNSEVVQLFDRLIKETAEHFDSEEKLLYQYRYCDLDEHKRIHQQLILSVKTMYEGLLSGVVSPISVAKYLIQEVVVGHIIKCDFDFFGIFDSVCTSGSCLPIEQERREI